MFINHITIKSNSNCYSKDGEILKVKLTVTFDSHS